MTVAKAKELVARDNGNMLMVPTKKPGQHCSAAISENRRYAQPDEASALPRLASPLLVRLRELQEDVSATDWLMMNDFKKRQIIYERMLRESL